MKDTMKKSRFPISGSFVNYGIVLAAYIIFQLLAGSGMLSNSMRSLLVPMCCYIVMAVSLNLTVGILGELSLGHAGFMSVGAFSGITAAMGLKHCFPQVFSSPIALVAIAMVVGAAFATVAGILIGIPVLRLRGDYLAIVTLAFGQIIKNIIMVLYIGVDDRGLHIALSQAGLNLGEGGIAIVKGPMGAVGVPKLASFTAGAVLVLITLFVVQNLVRSRSGRAIMALRDNRIAAESVGIDVTKYKMMAFVVSAALAGAAGALFGLNYSSTVSGKFDFNTSILVLVFVVLGGLGSIRGSMIAAALLYVLPELLRSFNIAQYRMLIYAVILILVMLGTNTPAARNLMDKVLRLIKRHTKGGQAK